MVNIGAIIKEKQIASGLTQKEFGERIKRSKGTILNIYKNNIISTDLLETISEVLQHDFFQYYYKEETPKQKEDKLTFLIESLIKVMQEIKNK